MIHCRECGQEIEIDTDNDESEEKILQAAQANGEPPICVLCLHLEMAKRYADHRRWEGVVFEISEIQKTIRSLNDSR